jgi:hypothetical protein
MNPGPQRALRRNGQSIANADRLAWPNYWYGCNSRVLAQRQNDSLGGQCSRLQRPFIPELRQAQLVDQSPHGHTAGTAQRMRLDVFRLSFINQASFSRRRLCLHADVLGIQILRARKHRAQIAFATVQRAGDHRVFGTSEEKRLHGAMRFNGMPEKISGAIFRAETTLVTGRSSNSFNMPPWLLVAQKQWMRAEKALAILKERQASAKREAPQNVSVVDPEAAWVKKHGKFLRGYSGQVVADSEHQVIVGLKATSQGADNDQLNPMLREVEKTTGQTPKQLVADSGYYTDDAVLEASRSKTDCVVPDYETAAQLNNPKRNESKETTYHVSRFMYDEANDEFTCPQGKRLAFVGNHKKRGQPMKVYRCKDCRDCPVRAQCTEHASGFRSIEPNAEHAEVRRIREKFKTESARAIYKKRKAIIEPIFGRWQHNWGIQCLRLRGLAGFSAELHLLAIAHNATKLFRFQRCVAEAAVTG